METICWCRKGSEGEIRGLNTLITGNSWCLAHLFEVSRLAIPGLKSSLSRKVYGTMLRPQGHGSVTRHRNLTMPFQAASRAATVLGTKAAKLSAEMLLPWLTSATFLRCLFAGGWRLLDTTIYVTLEPCPMCAGALLQARVGTLVFGAPNPLLGAAGSWIKLLPVGRGPPGHCDSSFDGQGSIIGPRHTFHPGLQAWVSRFPRLVLPRL